MEDLLGKLAKIQISPEVYKTISEGAGVYVFFAKEVPIYIGKAINLKRRVGSYFDLDLAPKTEKMVSEATELSFIRVDSELEALLLEARLIRKYMPHYNVAAKDDKHPLYIVITKEKYPRVITARKIDLKKGSTLAAFGPFPSTNNVRSVLRMLRRIFPYSDHKLGSRGCLYSHIGLCNPCPSEVEQINNLELKIRKRREYLKNVRRVKSVLSGKFTGIRQELVKEMEKLSDSQKFEEAKVVRDQISKLDYITQPQIPSEYFIENPNLYEDTRKKELDELKKILNFHHLPFTSLSRIECFDIAHFAGTNTTASMVTFIDGEADKNYYRHFKILQKKGNSDADSLREVIKRRIKHVIDWGKPDLIIVDGGKSQVSIFSRELEDAGIRVVGIAKRFETLVFPIHLDGTLSFNEYKLPRGNALNLVTRIRDEAHRFARRYHHRLISKMYQSENSS
jgi:excinuclease ABC subunit C